MDLNNSATEGRRNVTFFASLLGILFVAAIAVRLSIPDMQQALAHPELEEVPIITPSAGFYKDEVQVQVHYSVDPKARIIYTADGTSSGLKSATFRTPISLSTRTLPDIRLSKLPTSPIWNPPLGDTKRAAVIRARAYSTGAGAFSREAIQTYFFERPDPNKHTFPVLSLVVSEDDFFGLKEGIYVEGYAKLDKDRYVKENYQMSSGVTAPPANYKLRGPDWERPVFLQCFDANLSPQGEAELRARIHGNFTRNYPQKPIRLILDDTKPSQRFPKLLTFETVSDANSMILRNGGNNPLIRDALLHRLAAEQSVLTIESRPLIVYLNGEYWGIHNLRTHWSPENLARYYQTDPSQLEIVKFQNWRLLGDASHVQSFEDLLSLLRDNDPADSATMNDIAAQMDLPNLVDYLIVETYCGNRDWRSNVGVYRNLADENPRWRFLLFDLDLSFDNPNADMFELLKRSEGDNPKFGTIGLIFSRLMRNQELARTFVGRYHEWLATTLSGEHVTATIDQMAAQYDPYIQDHINRWRKPASIQSWQGEIDRLTRFATKRPEVLQNQLASLATVDSQNPFTESPEHTPIDRPMAKAQ